MCALFGFKLGNVLDFHIVALAINDLLMGLKGHLLLLNHHVNRQLLRSFDSFKISTVLSANILKLLLVICFRLGQSQSLLGNFPFKAFHLFALFLQEKGLLGV